VYPIQIKEVLEILSAAKAPKKDRKGNKYAEIIRRHVPLPDAAKEALRIKINFITVPYARRCPSGGDTLLEWHPQDRNTSLNILKPQQRV